MADLISMLAAAAGAAAGGGEVDPNFNQTVLLLHGDGTDGAQNNTFLDSGTANSGSGFTISRNGNATQGTFSPFSAPDGRWGVYHDGSSDYVTAGTTSSFNFVHNTSGLATIECWFYLNALTGVIQVLASNVESSASVGFVFAIGTTNKPYLATYRGVSGSAALSLETTSTVSANRWYHIAAVIDYSGNSGKLYLDGVLEDSEAFAQTPSTSNASYALHIGRNATTTFGSLDFAGYISNFRIVNSASVYTAAFTPPTSPLTAVTDTKLLIHQSNRFVDNSASPFTLTVSGLKVTPFSPFAPTAAYSPSVNGGSGYFDQTTDSLNAGASSAFDITSGNFTVEMWLYRPTGGAEQYLFSQRANSPVSGWEWRINATNFQSFFFSGGSIVTGLTAIPTNSWVHLAVTRSTNTVKLFINGVEDNEATFSNGTSASTVNLLLGAGTTGGGLIVGYCSNARIVKGTAIDFASTGIPTAPLTNITNTSLLLNFTNAGIFDNTGKNNLETIADCAINTTTKKYGTGSMEFDGTGDWLLARSNPNCSFETGDFTIEGWLYPTAVTGTDRVIWDTRASSGDLGMVLFITTTGTLSTYTSGAVRLTSTSSLSANVWTHFALVRSSGTLAFYLNGTQSGTLPYTTAITCPGRVSIGVRFDDLAPYTGYIDDLRITKGVARTITVPTKAYPDL